MTCWKVLYRASNGELYSFCKGLYHTGFLHRFVLRYDTQKRVRRIRNNRGLGLFIFDSVSAARQFLQTSSRNGKAGDGTLVIYSVRTGRRVWQAPEWRKFVVGITPGWPKNTFMTTSLTLIQEIT